MPKDFKNSPPPRDSGRTAHPMLLGILIGLLMGIVIALAVALWLNRLSNPFVEKARPIEPLAKIGPTQPPKPEEKAAAPEKKPAAEKAPEKKAADRPRFEFYTMLPGEKEVTDRDAKAKEPAKAREPAKDPPKAGPGSSPAQPKPHSGETYWLQAGAFADEKDAENLKAKIAFTGLEAAIKSAEVPGKGTLHRVRLGPYQSLDDANRTKAVLSQNGVGATIIRTDEAKTR
jgi:cell division protein FtsN